MVAPFFMESSCALACASMRSSVGESAALPLPKKSLWYWNLVSTQTLASSIAAVSPLSNQNLIHASPAYSTTSALSHLRGHSPVTFICSS